MSVFLSYARKNIEIAVRLEKRLLAADIEVWRDLRDIQGGDDWEDEIRSAIRASSCFIYLGSPAARESRIIRAELKIAKTDNKPIYPVFAEGQHWTDVAPMDIINMQYIDIRGPQYQEGVKRLIDVSKRQLQPGFRTDEEQQKLEDDNVNKPDIVQTSPQRPLWRRLAKALLGVPRTNKPGANDILEREQEQKLEKPKERGPRNPYKGLRAFTREDAQDFFGRENVVKRIIMEIKYILEIEQDADRRQHPRFVTMVGPSGSGKSSVVMAGLLPRLQKGHDIPGSNLWILLPIVRPGEKPLLALAQAISQKLVSDVSRAEILRDLQDQSFCALHTYAEQIASQPGSRVILLVDQFEELFTQAADEGEREQFIHQLVTAATEPENKVFVIATLRVDFSDRPMHYPLLHDIIEAHRIAIPPMTVEDLRAVIEGPAKLPDVRLRFEENLVSDLLFAIHGQEENLPLLQFTLTKLFDQRTGHRLTRQAYGAIGGVIGALNQHAEETYNGLPSAEHRRMAEVLFTRLINPGGLEQDATRRRVPALELAFEDAIQHKLMQETLRAFIEARLITANQIAISQRLNWESTVYEAGGIPIYEISHEALISAWTRLAGWTNTARDDMLVRQTLDNDIEMWEKQQKPDGSLYTGDRLAKARAWAEKLAPTKREEDFLQASKRYERRRRQRKNIQLGASIGLSLLLIAAVVIAGLQGFFYFRSRPTTVTTLQDNGPGSLRQIIQTALPGSTITFDPSLSGGTIVLLHGDLNFDVNKNLIVAGPETGKQISITNSIGKNKYSHYRVHIGADVSITFSNLAFRDSRVENEDSIFSGAFVENEGNLTLEHCLIKNNSSDSNGGGVANLHGTLTITDSEISDNSAQRNGGGIYSWDGEATLNKSTIKNNHAKNDGGGIYELSNRLTLNDTIIFGNSTLDSNATTNGGGMSVLDGELVLSGGSITGNTTQGYGGGVALLGTAALIDKAVIFDNHAVNQTGKLGKGGGLAVEKDSESGLVSQASIAGTEVETSNANRPKTSYYIWNNTADLTPQQPNILGQIQPGSLVTVSNDTSEITGSPAPPHPPEQTPQFLGTINPDAYCHTLDPQYPKNSTVHLDATNVEDILCEHLQGTRPEPAPPIIPIDPQKVCQLQYNQPDVISRLADYYDPSSWQCYKHEQRLGLITPYISEYCKDKGYKGVAPTTNSTAYSWYCQDQQGNPISIAITDVCQWHYGQGAFDRLTNFKDRGGWECWAPK